MPADPSLVQKFKIDLTLPSMKRTLTSLTTLVFLTGILWAQTTLSDEDRDKAIRHLKATQSNYLKTVKGLSGEQLNFKPDAASWSVAQCIEHITATEQSLFSLVEATLQNDPDLSLRSEVKLSDEEVIGIMESREQKVKTRPELEPTDRYQGVDNSLDEFKAKRKSIIKYVKSTEDDLRNRYFDFPFGKVDAYQIILFLSAHVTRHTRQIEEVMANANYPDS